MSNKPEEVQQLKEKYDKVCQELEATKSELLEKQKERDEVKSELHDIREELERTQSQMDEILGELEQTHFELHQIKEKGEEKNSQLDAELKKELEQTNAKLRETEELLDKSQSQLGETMEVLEEYQSQMEETMGVLEESQGKLQQKQEELDRVKAELGQKRSESEVKKELEKTNVKLRESEKFLEQYQSKFEQILNVLEVSPSQLQPQQKSQIDDAVVKEELMKVIRQYTSKERTDNQISKFAKGSIQQGERIAKVAEYCAQNFPGDFIEIGCFKGGTTKLLAEVAKKYNRKVIALDPWETGTQNCQGGEYEAFLANIEPYKNYVDIIRASSLDEKAIELVGKRQLSFAFVDGLHTYDACLVDIKTVSHCDGIIAVDDISWSPEVENAFNKGAEITKRQNLFVPVCREGYLLISKS